jgi:hypothetical protein
MEEIAFEAAKTHDIKTKHEVIITDRSNQTSELSSSERVLGHQ